jgi:hypothetical protein
MNHPECKNYIFARAKSNFRTPYPILFILNFTNVKGEKNG